MRILALSALLSGLLVATAGGQNLSGEYTCSTDADNYSLILSQAPNGTLTGTYTDQSGQKFRVDGTAEDGNATGKCLSDDKTLYLEAELEGGRLQVVLVEMDEEGMPDFENARNLTFTPKSKKPNAEEPPKAGLKQPDLTGERAQPPAAGKNEVTGPSWGFSFTLPKGWKQQATDQGAILGHDTIAGMILVLPHNLRTLDDVEGKMREGLEEEEGQLVLAGDIKSAGDSIRSGEYTGVYQGNEVKGHAVGTLSPYGGGAFLIAVATPDKFSSKLSGTVDAIAKSMRYRKPAASAVPSYFVGTWVTTTKNTETRMTFREDGTFSEYGEASYSDGAGTDEAWGTAGSNSSSGRWTARGNREQGVLTITYDNGKKRDVPYQVHVENGETYWSEYYFAGDLYGKQ